ncbi:MAG: hypothetical protein MRJ93_10305 [Nitrososphaeraceae archaeon]|nr:hypothetical protein [Nitrososphaeraceae archaeon]
MFAVSDDNIDLKDKKDKKFQLDVVINLDNLKQDNPQLFKSVAFINGDIKTHMLDIKKNATTGSKNSKIVSSFYFNKTNDVSTINAGDEYFVCGYVVKKDNNDDILNASTNNNQLMLYDCNEGAIASTNKDSIGLFSTMNKFAESSDIYQTSSNTLPSSSGVTDDNKVKITLLNPIDAKKIAKLDNVKFTGMVKGDYQIKKVDIKNEIKKSNIKDILKIPFVFNVNTEIGPIQLGDMFFGCITAEDYSSAEHSECEKRYIKSFDKSNDFYPAH